MKSLLIKLIESPAVFIRFLLAVALLSAVIGFFLFGSTGILKRDSLQNIYGEPVEQKQPDQIYCSDDQKISYYTYEGDDPVWKDNNKFGLYVYAENKDFFERAEELVNSKDGDWGYVLIPYNVKDYDYQKWEQVFEQLRDKHLIPVIQLHDVDLDAYPEQTKKAASFLNLFIWPIRYRYVSVYNEPNDKNFWYGKVDPAEYAKILNFTIDAFKSENPDFYMLNAGLNASASDSSSSMDSLEFMRQMELEVPGIFDKLDGWASHSYPQPNFSGSPSNTGRWSIQAYDSELAFLKNIIKTTKDLPVFITETGWAHAEGANYNSSFLPDDTVADYLVKAYEDVWLKDARVRAVMPFTVRYDPPYDHFSWLNKDNVPYKHFDVVKSMKKVKGKPPKLVEQTITIKGCN